MIVVVRLLPANASYGLSRVLALITWTCFSNLRRTTLRNLELFYQHRPASEKPSRREMRRIGRAAAVNLGYHVIEFMRMGYLNPDKAIEMVVETEGLEYYQEALAAGNGAIGLAMHYGNWEMSGAYLSLKVSTLYAVGKEQRDDFFTKLAFPWRKRYGIVNIMSGDKVQSGILRALRENRVLGLVADQNGGSTGTFVPFCGIPASTVIGPAALTLKTGAPLLPTICKRLGPGRLKMVIKPPLDTSGLPADHMQAIAEIMRRVNEAYEQIIFEDPTQWLWGHKRWKTRPPGEAWLY